MKSSKIFTIFSFLFLIVALSATASATLLGSFEDDADTYFQAFTGVVGTDQVVQEINITEDMNISYVGLYLYMASETDYNYTINLYSMSGGKPSGLANCSSAVQSTADLPATTGTATWKYFELIDCPELSANTTVFVGYNTSSASGMFAKGSNNDEYAGGQLWSYVGFPINNFVASADDDLWFRLYDSEGPATNAVTGVTLSPADQTILTTAGTQTFTGTAVGSIVEAGSVSCTYTIYRGGSTADGESGSGSFSSPDCTFTKTFSSTADNGEWQWTVTIDDGVNTPVSSSAKINVQLPGSGSGNSGSTSVPGSTTSQNHGLAWAIAIVIIIILSVTIYFAKAKK